MSELFGTANYIYIFPTLWDDLPADMADTATSKAAPFAVSQLVKSNAF